MKFSTKELFVACRVYDYEIETEPWVQYESFGTIEHHIVIDPKRKLIRKEIENGQEKLIDCKTNKRVYISNFTESFWTESSCTQSVFLSDYPLGPLSDNAKKYFERKTSQIQFLIPLDEYIKERLGIEIKELTIKQALFIINLLNLRETKSFTLSFNNEEAKEQIETLIYKKHYTKYSK